MLAVLGIIAGPIMWISGTIFERKIEQFEREGKSVVVSIGSKRSERIFIITNYTMDVYLGEQKVEDIQINRRLFEQLAFGDSERAYVIATEDERPQIMLEKAAWPAYRSGIDSPKLGMWMTLLSGCILIVFRFRLYLFDKR